MPGLESLTLQESVTSPGSTPLLLGSIWPPASGSGAQGAQWPSEPWAEASAQAPGPSAPRVPPGKEPGALAPSPGAGTYQDTPNPRGPSLAPSPTRRASHVQAQVHLGCVCGRVERAFTQLGTQEPSRPWGALCGHPVPAQPGAGRRSGGASSTPRPSAVGEHTGRFSAQPGDLTAPSLLLGLRALRPEGSRAPGFSPPVIPGCPVPDSGAPAHVGGRQEGGRWWGRHSVLSLRPPEGARASLENPGSPRGRCAPRTPRVGRKDAAPLWKTAPPPWRGPPRFLERRGPGPSGAGGGGGRGGSRRPGLASGKASAIAPKSIPGAPPAWPRGGTPKCALGPCAPQPLAGPAAPPGCRVVAEAGPGGREVTAARHGAREPAPGPAPRPPPPAGSF